MPAIRPYQSIDEHDNLVMFTYEGTTPAAAGTFVKVNGSGYVPAIHTDLQASVGLGYQNTLSPRFIGSAKVVPTAASGDAAIGMLLYEVRELDENGEKLIFHPRKADENNWNISGKNSTLATKGVFFYSGAAGVPAAGSGAYLRANGDIGTVNQAADVSLSTKVGKFLSARDVNGWVLFKLEL